MDIKVIERTEAPPKQVQSGKYELDEAVLSLDIGAMLQVQPAKDETLGQIQMRAANTQKRLRKMGSGKDIDYWKGPGAVYIEVKAADNQPQNGNHQN